LSSLGKGAFPWITSIQNILTFRYDPGKPAAEKKLGIRDFKENNYRLDIPSKIESILKNEIKRRISKADNVAIPIGTGIDSAVIMTLAKEVFPSKNIFGISLGFHDSRDETNGAKQICNSLGVDCHVVIVENALADLPLQIRIAGEPRWNLWYYYVLERAKKLGANIILTGDGGDELFAGYVFRYAKYLNLIQAGDEPPFSFEERETEWIKRAWSYFQCHNRDWVPDQERMFGSELSSSFDWYSMMRYFKPYFNNNMKGLNQVFLADYNGKLLYDWIPTNSRLSNYFGIKSSSPFMADSIIEIAPHIALEQKYDVTTQEGKLILREILKRHEMLQYVAKNKQGFGMDLVTLWKKQGRELADKYLHNAAICQRNIINKAWLSETMNSSEKSEDPRYINKMLQLTSLEIWYRDFGRNEIQMMHAKRGHLD